MSGRHSTWLRVALALGLAALLTLASGAREARADVVYLKNGAALEGVILRTTEEVVVLKTDAGTLSLARADIDRIEKKDFQPAEVLAPAPQPAPQPEAAPPALQEPSVPPAPSDETKGSQLRLNSLTEVELVPQNYWLRALLVTKGKKAGDESTDHVGFNHTVLTPLSDGSGYELFVESVLLTYSRRLDSYLTLTMTTNKKLEPVRYTAELLSRRRHIRVTGEKQDDQLLLTTTSGDETETRLLKYPDGCVVFDCSMYQVTCSAVSLG